MFKLNGYELKGVDYIVVDEGHALNNEASLELLASRHYGVGADRLLLVKGNKLVSVMDNSCRVQVPAFDDYQVFNVFAGRKEDDMVSRCEIRLTDYFLQQLITAGSVYIKMAC